MLSKRFMAWVGVGVLSAATIPAFAAPHLARLAARHPAPAQNQTKPAATKAKTPPKSPQKAKPTAAAHPTALTSKKTVTTKAPAQKLSRVQIRRGATSAGKPAAHKMTSVTKKPTTLAHKPAAAHKPLSASASHKPTASATAKKLLH
ncbi:MAG TPA: hypothetical protein VH475_05795 [Tepidisphaeraceae bacterium]|jgi:hypothetical protein